MSIVLIKHYKKSDSQETTDKALQTAFVNKGVNAVVVPADLSVEWLPGIGKGDIAVIHTLALSNSQKLQMAADKLKADLAEHDVQAIILPADTGIEVIPF